MKKKLSLPFLILLLVALFLGANALFTVNETEQVLVLQFGRNVGVHKDPGLKVKVPFIQEVVFYEKRVLDYDLPPIPVTTGDQKRLVVNAYTRYRIADPVKFFQSIKPADEMGARLRLEAIISSIIRNAMGRVELRRMLSEDRIKVMKETQTKVREQTSSLGIEIIDVRIIRTELPPENRQAVFARMNSSLIRIAKENRAKGEEEALGIRARADKQKTVLLAEARKKAKIIQGEGQAEAIKIAAEAHEKDPDFYAFIRALELYESAIKEDTNVILSTGNDLFRFFTDPDKRTN